MIKAGGNIEAPKGSEELISVDDQQNEDIFLLETVLERDKGDTISYEQFQKEMGWN